MLLWWWLAFGRINSFFIEEDPTYICYVYIIYWKFLSSNRNLLFVYYAFINMSTKKN